MKKLAALFITSIFYGHNLSAQCSTVDQSQLTYNGGMSARNLAQYTVWQDFTPTVTGTLCQLDIGFFNPMTGAGTLNIYTGTGTGGTLLQTQTVMVSGTGNFFQSFSVSAPVTAGAVYTFQFIPTLGGGLPDPYGVQIESPGTYAGGQMETTDPSGTYPTGFDMVFKTYVTIATNVSSIESIENLISLFPNPASESISFGYILPNGVSQGLIKVYDIVGQLMATIQINKNQGIEVFNLDKQVNGIYFYNLIVNNTNIDKGKFVINK